MTTDEKLDLLLQKITGIETDVSSLKTDMKVMSERIDGLEMQIKHTERTLKNEIHKSESLVLDEVERVHTILDKHMHNKSKHTA